MFIEVRRKDVKTLVAQGRARLLDVRPGLEYEKEHLPGAISLPLETLTPAAARILQKDQVIILYSSDSQCDLSARAAWRLESMGFYEVYRYAAGQADWLAAGLETEGTENKKVRIRHMIHRDVPTCRLSERLQDVKSRRRQNQDVCVVVSEGNIVLGIIQGKVWNENPEARVADVMEPAPQTLRPDLEPKDAQKILRGYQAPLALVTTSDGELLGAVRIAQKKAQRETSAA